MKKLWAEQRPPETLEWSKLPEEDEQTRGGEIHDQAVWSLRECGRVFAGALSQLHTRLHGLPVNDHLTWDKDDAPAMDFVAAVANFHPNAEIGGLIVQEALKILGGGVQHCKTLWLKKVPNPRGLCIVPESLAKPCNGCYVCSDSQISVKVDTKHMLVKEFKEKVLHKALNLAQPDIMATIGDNALILISSEEGKTEINEKKLCELHIGHETVLYVEDFCRTLSSNSSFVTGTTNVEDYGALLTFTLLLLVTLTSLKMAKSLSYGHSSLSLSWDVSSGNSSSMAAEGFPATKRKRPAKPEDVAAKVDEDEDLICLSYLLTTTILYISQVLMFKEKNISMSSVDLCLTLECKVAHI